MRAFLGAQAAGHADGFGHLRARLDASALPKAVRERAGGVGAPPIPSMRGSECLLSVPRTARSEAKLDLAGVREILDVGHAEHAAAKERLLDYHDE